MNIILIILITILIIIINNIYYSWQDQILFIGGSKRTRIYHDRIKADRTEWACAGKAFPIHP